MFQDNVYEWLLFVNVMNEGKKTAVVMDIFAV